MRAGPRALVLGVGNQLMRDDAAGPLVVRRLLRARTDRAKDIDREPVRFRDGGTIGLSLLPEIEDADAFVAVDAARFDAEPGTVRVFEGDAMDRQLGGRKRSAHEVALADLMAAAALAGRLPARRALVAVQPQSVDLGLEPTPPVADAIERMCDEVDGLLRRWGVR